MLKHVQRNWKPCAVLLGILVGCGDRIHGLSKYLLSNYPKELKAGLRLMLAVPHLLLQYSQLSRCESSLKGLSFRWMYNKGISI